MLEYIGLIILVELSFFVLVFIIAQIIKDNSIVDIAWGFSYVVLVNALFLIKSNQELQDVLIVVLISVWGLRLTYHIGKRNIGKPEDYRYVAMRKRWGNERPKFKAFTRVFMLQMALMLIVSMPISHVMAEKNDDLSIINIVGIIVYIIGFLFESIGDYQLKKFKQNPENKGKLMTKGLWAYTRHPNYFGDATMWWGIYLIVFESYVSLSFIIGPIVMNILLVYVSGANLLEKKYKNREDYIEYSKHTNRFIPMWRKK